MAERLDEQQKRSKVVSCTFKNEYTGQYGTTYYYIVAFENGDAGEVGMKKKDDDYFQAGKEVDYKIWKTLRKDNVTKDTKIGKVIADSPYAKKTSFTKSVKSYKMEAVSQAMGHAVNSISVKPDADAKMLADTYDYIYNLMIKKLEAVDAQ